jgi:hypothetical protein
MWTPEDEITWLSNERVCPLFIHLLCGLFDKATDSVDK